MEPFLRWAGGKIWLTKEIDNYTPKDYNIYFEPFLGGGSIYFKLQHPRGCILSDLNPELINAYIQVRDDVDNVIKHLNKFTNDEINYYKIRESNFKILSKRAAQFIFLNKTSFNGIYRVNRQGHYNVPFGHRYTIDYIQEEILREASIKLKKTNIECQDFERALEKVKLNDFVFLDPPYTVAHANNNFVGYNQRLFSLDDQYRLSQVLKVLNRKGAKFILTNAFHKKIKEIYHDIGDFYVLKRRSLIGGKGASRELIKEYLIKNF